MSTFKSVSYISLLCSTVLFNGCGGGGGISTPKFTSTPQITMPENRSSVATLVATDTTAIKYSISNGDDKNLFSINLQTGSLRFKQSPDFENPHDLDKNNIYKVEITATNVFQQSSTLSLSVTILDLAETDISDSDNDYIPDNIEILIGSDKDNPDTDNNGIDDGLETTGVTGDIYFEKQWYIESLGNTVNDSGVSTIIGNDMNLLDVYHHYMGYNKGNNIIVQVVDNGTDADHEDLVDNMDLSRSFRDDKIGDPTAKSSSNKHGTMVAGIMAARGLNGIGVRGIAPFAKIAASNWLETQTLLSLEKIWLTGSGANEIAVSNNSWGSYYDFETVYEDIMQKGTSELRNGKGRLYIFAGGNDADYNGNTNLQYCLNNRYAFSVTALNHKNKRASYASIGANIIVSGYGGEYQYNGPTIATTTPEGKSSRTGDINSKTTWSSDTKENYTYAMNGTSAAAPTVAGALALVIEACPTLTWRDAKWLIYNKSKRVDTSHSSWVKNHAGLWHSIYYGFGLIDVKAMIDECRSGYTLLSAEKTTEATVNHINTVIPDDNTTKSFDINIAENMTIEWVEATIDNDSPYASDYEITLVSPSNTKSILMTMDTKVDAKNNWLNGGFRLSSAGFASESSAGTWKLEISDKLRPDSGTLKSIKLKIYGH